MAFVDTPLKWWGGEGPRPPRVFPAEQYREPHRVPNYSLNKTRGYPGHDWTIPIQGVRRHRARHSVRRGFGSGSPHHQTWQSPPTIGLLHVYLSLTHEDAVRLLYHGATDTMGVSSERAGATEVTVT